MSSEILENIVSNKDAYIFRHFCGGTDDKQQDHSDHHHHHQHDSSSHLDTKDIDINALLTLPLDDRTQKFYNRESSEQVEAVLQSTKPWKSDENYFQNAHVSSLALLKMTMHAKSGGSIEVMGMLTGKITKNGIVVMDVYPLPVEGTETRVNAQAEGYEFMVQYLDSLKKTGRNENIVGWYHSHPGYGCWLSGIDVGTEELNQKFQDPYLAIVVDPMKTVTNGLVEIGAFRTYTDQYVQNNKGKTTGNNFGSFGSVGTPINSSGVGRGQTIRKKAGKIADIPAEKIKDFGQHASKYYSLSVDVFRSDVDHMILSNLWNKFWINSLVGNGDDTDQEVELDKFLNEKLVEMEKKMDTLRKIDVKSPQLSARDKQPSRRPGKGGFYDGAEMSNARGLRVDTESRGGAAGLMERFQALSGDRLSPSFLSKQQLSPFTKANLLSKMSVKDKEPESDAETDSEMNDADSDIDMPLQNDTDKETSGSVPRDSGMTRRPKQTGRSAGLHIVSPTQPGGHSSGPQDAMSIKRRTENDKVRATAAEAGRNLVNLKIQELLFLNE